MAPRFQLLHVSHIFGHARLGYDKVDIARRWQRWQATETQDGGHAPKPEMGITIERNELATRFQRLPRHFRPHRTRL